MNESEIRTADQLVRQHFHYLPDVVDTWRSHLTEAQSGKPWQGDCDDLTSTILDDLSKSISLDDLYRLLVSTGGKTVDHMVGCVVDQNGNWLIVGDTAQECYPASECQYNILEYNRLSERTPEGAVWRSGAPFK